MKFITKVIVVLIVLTLTIGATAYYEIQHIIKSDPQTQIFSFNNAGITYKTATIKYRILGGLIPFDHTFTQANVATLYTDQILNTLVVNDDTQVKITTPDQKIISSLGSQTLAFEEDGRYKIELRHQQDESLSYYEFLVDVEIIPNISISNLNPSQGEILIIDIKNIRQNSTIEIQNQFSPSAISQGSHMARFYLPMEFKTAANTYPLTITINGKAYEFNLDVKAYEFNKQYFSIDADIIKNTSGNPIAVNEFKATIHPLYETAEPVEYWQGNFIIPVNNARISSNFGDMRYINGSKTPSRHGGIDYAISCGTDVSASNFGKVDYAGFLILTGNTVVIDHGLGLKTHYLHMKDLTVKTGDLVDKGQIIGHVGTTGVSTGCHLHFQAMIKTQQFNPTFLYKIEQ